MFLLRVFSVILTVFLALGELQARSYFQEAKYAFSMGEWGRAYKLFEKASAYKPQDGKAFFYMGYVREQQGHKTDAILNYQRAIDLKLDKDLKEKAFWKVTLYYKQTRNWEKLLHYSTEFLKLRQHRSIQKLKELAAKNHDPQQTGLHSQMQAAREYKEKGESKEAVRVLEKVLVSHPGHQRARWELVLLKIKKKDFHSASAHLEVLQSSAPRNWQYHYKKAVCDYHLSQYDSALKDLKKAKGLYSGNAQSFQFYTNYMLGNIHLEKGNFKSALKNLRAAQKARKEQSLGLEASLAYTYWHLKNYRKAKAYAQQAIQKESQEALAFLVLALCSWQAAKAGKAYSWAADMYSELKDSSEHENTHENKRYTPGFLLLGQEAIGEKNWRKALKFYKQADPASIRKISAGEVHRPLQKLAANFNYNFALSLMHNKQAQAALKYYAKAGQRPKVFFQQARCYALLLKGKEAKKYLQKAVQAKTEFWEKAQRDEAFQDLMEQDLEFQEFMNQGPP